MIRGLLFNYIEKEGRIQAQFFAMPDISLIWIKTKINILVILQ